MHRKTYAPDRPSASQGTVPETAPPAPVASASRRPPSLAAVIQRARANPGSLTRADILQLHRSIGNAAVGRLLGSRAAQNRTGLPDALKRGIEGVSGLSMDDVRVHRDSPKPAELQAHAYARGTEIHIGPGQERHLPHEAWHVVQQKQGRVRPTARVAGVAINDDPTLEREAEAGGARLASPIAAVDASVAAEPASRAPATQLFLDPKAPIKEAKAYIGTQYDNVTSRFERAVEALAGGGTSPTAGTHPLMETARNLKSAYDDGKTKNHQELIIVLNEMESFADDIEISDPENRLASDINIGTEFTFSAKDIEFTNVNDPDKSRQMAYINDWISHLKKHKRGKPKDHTGKNGFKGAKRIEYDFGKGESWWWVLDIDDGCLETQTCPSTLDALNMSRVRKIIEEDIFGAAGSAKLEPGVGGGHLSLDATQTFGNSAEALLNFIFSIEKAYADWDKEFEIPEADLINQPWLQELGALESLSKTAADILSRYRAGRMSYEGVVEAIKDAFSQIKNTHLSKLQKEADTERKKHAKGSAEYKHHSQYLDQIQRANLPADRLHYKAINIEHLLNEQRDSRGIELRRIESQTDFDNLAEHMKIVFRYLAASRAAVRARLREIYRISGKDVPPSNGEEEWDTASELDLSSTSPSTDYEATQMQSSYLTQHGLDLVWIEPDGRCMLSAMSHVIGRSSVEILRIVRIQVNQKNSKANSYVTEHGLPVPASELLENLENLDRDWASENADHIVSWLAYIFGKDFSVLTVDGGLYSPCQTTGAVLVKVEHPLSHYHYAKPSGT